MIKEKLDWLISLVFACALTVSVGMMFIVLSDAYCKYFSTDGEKYYQDSDCFDLDFRCTVECGNYGYNYTGELNGCMCLCDKGGVSYCSGFYYNESEIIR